MDMQKGTKGTGRQKESKGNLLGILKPYRGLIAILIFFTLAGNATNLVIPKLIARGIDSFGNQAYDPKNIIMMFAWASLAIFIFSYAQYLIQTFASEKVARDFRKKLSDKISKMTFSFVQDTGSSKLLTNLTSDVDSIKHFVSNAVSTIVSSIFMILGTSALLFTLNARLALVIITIIPIVAISFFIILKKVRVYYKKSREVIDWLNRVINESVIGAGIIRVLNTQHAEYNKFMDANTHAKDIGISILKLFAILIPIITFVGNMALLAVLALGGKYFIAGQMTLGDFAAFNSYIAMLIFPIIMIGFMSNVIAQATASYNRIYEVLSVPNPVTLGTRTTLEGNITCHDVSLSYNEKLVLKNISFSLEKGSQTAILGPTAAGKSLLVHLLNGLIKPQRGEVLYDGHVMDAYEPEAFMAQIATVFQESIVFNMSLRDNIAFGRDIGEAALKKAIQTAELEAFIDSLPQKWDTIVSERGSSLSGGQKQRIMLARALAKDPKILFLDDFTARVDRQTETKIQCNLMNNYPDVTLLAVTQKVSSVRHFDNIILLMEGEMVAQGKHEHLLATCPEYVQIHDSQLSTHHYEL
jgi:ATP-binding cassette, subfamily B, bacterial